MALRMMHQLARLFLFRCFQYRTPTISPVRIRERVGGDNKQGGTPPFRPRQPIRNKACVAKGYVLGTYTNDFTYE